MDENNVNVAVEEDDAEFEEVEPTMGNDELKKAIEEQMSKLRTQSMLLGSQAMCRVILQKIYEHLAKPGKKSYRDYERLVNDIKKFCEIGISRKVNEDGTTSEIEKTEPEQE